MPRKTYMKLASTMEASSSGRSARSIEGLGIEGDDAAGALLPELELLGEGEGELVVADEVVIDDEDLVAPARGRGEASSSRDELGGRLRARAAAIDGDDVAELALEGTAARELDRHGGVLVEVEKVEARDWADRHVRLIGDLIERAGGSRRPAHRRDRGKGFFGFADKNVVGAERGGIRARCWPRDHR